jgi:hypothetical protein
MKDALREKTSRSSLLQSNLQKVLEHAEQKCTLGRGFQIEFKLGTV